MAQAYDILIENFRQLVPISDQEAEIIKGTFVVKKLNKKELLLSKGDLSNHMRFVADGCLKVYSIGEKDMEHILQFGISGWWINDLYAYLTETPSELFIQAITPSTVLQIHRDRLNKLYDEIPMVDRFFRIKTQHGYVALQNRTIRTMSQTAEERYVKFISDYREMEQQIPQYMIAAFIGVTPEHLSAIRKKMSL
ncbi:Crp/Fnr family transcriptional regulator [Fulvivirga lutimaris]|uniref:Crp/Fnr family transcriptional regulator n=1 Tax=Fulvivirga lutimaris TaxID=1819566 RepID=UPI0012BD7A41|nr:Crp/Fnr family transcriptional regulator [Fulvivirga lutimaris]MTI39712.1 Crp/Fnr family transcriptional regulator [Fulvivirga lutimaris]